MCCKRFCVVAVAAVAFAVVQAGPVVAGDVTVDSGAGTITGDQDDNEIALYSADGMVWVIGREGTTINGGTEPVSFPHVPPLGIYMGDGDDTVDVRLALPGLVGLNIQSGGGDDEVVVKGGCFDYLNVWTDSEERWMHDGDDEVKIEDVTVISCLRLYTYGGNDEVVLRNTCTHDPDNFLHHIATGAGHDQIVIDSILAHSFGLRAGSGNDVVEFRGYSEADSSHIRLGDGRDVLDADASQGASLLSMLLWVDGDKGHDTLINGDYFQALDLHIGGFEVIED